MPRRCSDIGAATADFVLAVPLLFLTILFAIQAGVWFHATHVAQAAATRALDAARVEDGSATDGQAAGAQAISALGGRVLLQPSVVVTRTATQARVQITGRAATVVPGARWTVRVTAAAPVERFVVDSGQPPPVTAAATVTRR